MIPIHVKSVHEEHPDLVRRELHEVLRTANYALGRQWAVEMLPKHFEPGAANRYSYQIRKVKYLRRKRVLAALGRAEDGGMSYLVLRGHLRRALLRTARNAIRAYPTRVTIDLIGPSYFTSRPRRAGRPNLAREVTTVLQSEAKELARTFDQGFTAALRAVRSARRTSRTTRTTRRAA